MSWEIIKGSTTVASGTGEDSFNVTPGTYHLKLYTQQSGLSDYFDLYLTGTTSQNYAKRYYYKDHLGSTRAVVNETGIILEATDYYPFGMIMDGRSYLSGSPAKEKFTGKERDDETGFDHFGARTYSSELGRFMQVDPLAREFPNISPYAYGNNNPLRYTDPTGMAPEDEDEEDCPKCFETLKYAFSWLENPWNNAGKQIEQKSQQIKEGTKDAAEAVAKDGPEALDVAGTAAAQTTAILATGFALTTATPAPHDDLGLGVATAAAGAVTAVMDATATSLSILDAEFYGGSKHEAKLRAQLTVFGMTSSYGAKLIYGSSFKSSILNYHKKAAATTIGIMSVETLKQKND